MFFPVRKWRATLRVSMFVSGAVLPALSADGGTLVSGSLVRDQVPWSFTRAAMTDAPRSIVVPLATNLHLAFDAEKLRVHTVWSGPRPALAGYQFGLGVQPFATLQGTALWQLPSVCPWQVGALKNPSVCETPSGSHFRGVSTKGGQVTFLYDVGGGDGQLIRIHETARVETNWPTHTIIRRFEIAPSPQTLWYLAHEEAGATTESSTVTVNASVIVKRTADSLLASVRGTESRWHIQPAPTNRLQLWLEIPPHRKPVAVEIATSVGTNVTDALAFAATWASSPAEPPRMTSVTKRSRSSGTSSAPIFTGQVSDGRREGDEFFQREQIPVPRELELLVGGMDWMPNGDLAICTWPGEVYLARNFSGPATNLVWQRFASGLHEPLGLKVVNGVIHIAQKAELTRLIDTDGNGEADLYECVNADWGFDGNMHYFAYGPALDARGNFLITLDGNTADWKPRWDSPYRGWAVKISPDGRKLEGVCSGMRSPNGCFAYGRNADIFATDNEGYWLGACKLNHVRPGRFFGYPSSTPRPREVFQKPDGFDPPAIWFPRKLATSASGGVEIPKGVFGPFAGQMLVGDFGTSSILRVALEQVNGEWQGAVWPFARGFRSGVNRLLFDSAGRLLVGQLRRRWSSSGTQEFGLERVSFTGRIPFEVERVHARRDGFELVFTHPVDPSTASHPEDWDVKQFGYKFHSAYGSPEIDHSGKENAATSIIVSGVKVSQDHRRVQIRLTGLRAGYVTAVRSKSVQSAEGDGLRHDTFYYTLNQLPK